jgi:hypothetical protein
MDLLQECIVFWVFTVEVCVFGELEEVSGSGLIGEHGSKQRFNDLYLVLDTEVRVWMSCKILHFLGF